MLVNKFNPLKNEMLQILDENGHVINQDDMPNIAPEKLLEMYKTMVYSRVIDTKTLQFQRQGRMLTYAPNLGQEAAQLGSIAATEKTDWMASAFRELGAWLWRGAPLYNLFLYWYGNEEGMHMPDDVRILPVSVPIASQLQHAVGLGYAAQYKGESDIAIGYVGDGGTSQGDFHEALNFATTLKAPVVFIIQNNQYAISVSRSTQTRAETLAQKAVAYGLPGLLVDGNDLLAVYAAVKEAADRARRGDGPTLIEAYTYRMGAHTTADDPTVYRDDEEVEAWKLKDPIDRMRKYLIRLGQWSEEKDESLKKELEEKVKEAFKSVENSGVIPLEDVFKYQYAEMTPHLKEQYKALKAYEEKEGK